ncbi:MAG TPA: hypothetical protein VMZ50_13350, partial [Phycisphaerae bacterium]|nr:hypothetical protein [Phycisphaerae bacterium]
MRARGELATWLWGAAAVVFLAGAALLQIPLNRVIDSDEQIALSRDMARKHPEYLLLTIAPGGLRAPFVCYLWIRAEDLKDQGRFYDAKQNADMICSLQPRFTGAWSFNAWNMTYNISAATHTGPERWKWVNNGIELLRDRAIQYNPKSLNLYKELSWILFHKIGGFSDDMHWYYKRRWAAEMQRLLASPPTGTTQEVIDAFRPIAEAPLDKVPPKQELPLPWAALVCAMFAAMGGLVVLAVPRFHNTGGFAVAGLLLAAGVLIFGISLLRSARSGDPGAAMANLRAEDRLLADPQVRRYAELLSERGIGLGWPLLEAYNRFSMDEDLRAVRTAVPKVETPSDKARSDLINDPGFAEAREKVLAFVRAKILFEKYKMDPAWMLKMMEEYGPLDWRLIEPHSLYWSTYGLNICKGTP